MKPMKYATHMLYPTVYRQMISSLASVVALVNTDYAHTIKLVVIFLPDTGMRYVACIYRSNRDCIFGFPFTQ